MSDDFAEPLPSSGAEVKVDTSKPRRRSRSPEDRCKNIFVARMTHDLS